jgi:hypothetical protein
MGQQRHGDDSVESLEIAQLPEQTHPSHATIQNVKKGAAGS